MTECNICNQTQLKKEAARKSNKPKENWRKVNFLKTTKLLSFLMNDDDYYFLL